MTTDFFALFDFFTFALTCFTFAGFLTEGVVVIELLSFAATVTSAYGLEFV